MQDTLTPQGAFDLERLRTAASLQRARKALLVKPAPLAPDLAQGVLFPLLQAIGVDIFDLESLRLEEPPSSQRVRYRVSSASGDDPLLIELLEVETPLPRVPVATGEGLLVLTNGRHWRAHGAGEFFDFDLLDSSFAEALHALLHTGGEPLSRIGAAKEALAQRQEGAVRQTLGGITAQEVKRHAQPIRNLRGMLQTTFNGEPVEEINSRSAFYFVLASLALDHGREDAIPPADLVRPPDRPPSGRRSRPLGRSGWYLLLDHDTGAIEKRTAGLLAALRLNRSFVATQHGEPYPAAEND